MNISRLDHVNIRTSQLDVMIKWYTEILGFAQGPRPNFPFGGAWMYRHGEALVHLVDAADAPQGTPDNVTLEHAAFRSKGLEAFAAHLDAHGERYERIEISDFGITQMNIWDPDGNHLHIDFHRADGD